MTDPSSKARAGEVNFVLVNWKKWQFGTSAEAVDLAMLAANCTSNEDIWIAQTFLQLASRGVPVTISRVPLPGRVNIVDGISFPPQWFSPHLFFVGCRGDGHYPALCQMVIHQNTIAIPDQPAAYIPQWPQPGIIPRDSSRQGIKTLGFIGHAAINLARPFRKAEFVHALRGEGYEFLVRGKSEQAVSWNDYSDIDLVLAVRDIPHEHLLTKPVSKLTNAWLAGCPALLGAEPAVQAIAHDDLDYLAVATPADVFAVLEHFKEKPAEYDRRVAHCRRRAIAFGADAVAARWILVLDEMKERYLIWHGSPMVSKQSDFAARSRRHQQCMRQHFENVHAAYQRMGYTQHWWQTPDASHLEVIGADPPLL